jgi:hypothetical protein
MSKASLFRRLQKLEQCRPVDVKAVESPAPRIIASLTAAGFVRDKDESWAEVWARSMGMTCMEVKAELIRRSAGCG